MAERLRVPLPSRQSVSWVGEDEIAASITRTPAYARRFSMDVAEEVLARMGRETLPHIAQKLAERAVYEHSALIENAVHEYLDDPAWCQPIIEDAIRRTVERFIADIFRAALSERRDSSVGSGGTATGEGVPRSTRSEPAQPSVPSTTSTGPETPRREDRE